MSPFIVYLRRSFISPLASAREMQVDFYFGPGSRYSYLAATQLQRLAAETSATFRWRPVLSADLVARTGGKHRSPQEPEYRRKDIERWARYYGVPFAESSEQIDWRSLALSCVAADHLGAVEGFARALYEALYGRGEHVTDDRLHRIVMSVGLDADAFMALTRSNETAAAYEKNLSDALGAGAFGVPTFVTDDGEVFWGQDRLPLLRQYLLEGRTALEP